MSPDMLHRPAFLAISFVTVRGRASAAWLGLLAGALSATHLEAGDPLPVRKPGQWELKTVSAATGTITSRVCITNGDSIVVPGDGRSCQPPGIKRAGDQTIVNVVCKTDQGEERISTLLTGDFSTWYRAIVKMTFDPPGSGPPNLGVTIDGRYLGEGC